MLSGSDISQLSELLDESSKMERKVEEKKETINSKSFLGSGGDNSIELKPFHKSVPLVRKEDVEKKTENSRESEVKNQSSSNEIWDKEEVNAKPEEVFFDPSDERIRPEFEFSYRQKVGVEDVFFGMDNTKRNDITTCDEIVVSIFLPKCEDISGVELDVKNNKLSLYDPIYKLFIPLPKKVFESECDAKWIVKEKKLAVSIPIDKFHVDIEQE